MREFDEIRVDLHSFHNCSVIFSVRDPWSYDNLYGWIGEYAFQLVSSDLYLIISMVFASFFISVCLHHRAFSEQFEALLHQLNARNNALIAGMAAHGHDEPNQRHKIQIFLHRIVQFHILLTE